MRNYVTRRFLRRIAGLGFFVALFPNVKELFKKTLGFIATPEAVVWARDRTQEAKKQYPIEKLYSEPE